MKLNHAPFPLAGRRVVLLAGGAFSTFGSKTAACYIRYRSKDVVCVVDSSRTGCRVQDVLGFGGDIPVVGSVADALSRGADLAIVGTAPRGGRLTEALRRQLGECLAAGLDVASGLHTFLDGDAELSRLARESGARIWDVRRVPAVGSVATGSGCTTGAHVVLMVGTDCNVGKMTATVEIYNEARRRGLNAAWAATGQTGILLRERGIAVDRVVADFIGGAAEALVNEEGEGKDLVIVEGQGSLLHPGFAGVTLGLLYGVMPDTIVLAHAAGRRTIGDSTFPMPALGEWISRYELAVQPLKPARVVAVALNGTELDEGEARAETQRLERETGLPVVDPVREGAARLVDAICQRIEPAGGGI